MNTEQVKEILDSFNVCHRQVAGAWSGSILLDHHFCIKPHTAERNKIDPSKWLIYRLVPVRAHLATISDEFELQDWLINEYNTN